MHCVLYCINKSLYLAQYHVCLLTILEKTPVNDNIAIASSVFYGTCPAYLTNIVEPAGAGRTRSGQRRRKQFESGGARALFRREAPEKFLRVPPIFGWCLTGGTRQKCGAHNVLTVILVIVNEERKT